MSNTIFPWENTSTNDVSTVSSPVFPWEKDEVKKDEAPMRLQPMVIVPKENNVEDVLTASADTSDNTNEDIGVTMEVPERDLIIPNTAEEMDAPTEATKEEKAEMISKVVEVATNNIVTDMKDENISVPIIKTEEKDDEELSGRAKSLTTLPATDNNFTTALENATIEELQEAFVWMNNHPEGNKTRIAKVKARISKLAKEKFETEISDTDSVENTSDVSENTETKETPTEKADETKQADENTEETSDIPKEPIFKEDEFAKINQQDIADKDKAILYMINHYHISPNLLNCLIEGNFENAWADISSMNKENMTVKAKLEKELKGADDSRLKVAEYLLDKATKEPSFAVQILLEHKEFERCYKYITDKVRETYTGTNPNCVQVDDDKVYQWAVDYYNLDDFAEVMAERKAEEEKKKKAAEARKKKSTKSTTKKATTKTSTKTTTTDTTTVKDASTNDDKKDVPKTEPITVKPDGPVEDSKDKVVADPSKDNSDAVIDVEKDSTVTAEQQKTIDKIVEQIDKKREEEVMIADSFGQLSFNF